MSHAIYGLPWVGLALLVLSMPIFIARRLHTEKHSFPKYQLLVDSLLLLCPFTYIVIEGWFFDNGKVDGLVVVAFFTQLSVIALLILSLFIPPHNRHRQVRTSQILIVSYLSSMIIIGFLPSLYYQEEQRQFAKDTLAKQETALMSHLETRLFEFLKNDLEHIAP